MAVKILKDLAGQSGDSLRVWNPLTGHARRPHDDRRPAHPSRAPGRRGLRRLRLRGRRRRPGVAAAELVGKSRHAAHDSRYGRRVHRLLHRGRPGRVEPSRQSAGQAVRKQWHGTRAQRDAARDVQPHHRAADGRSRARRAACATGSTRTCRATSATPPALPGDAAEHVLWAADVWYSIKKHWCIEAQRFVRAHRADAATAVGSRSKRRRAGVAAGNG